MTNTQILLIVLVLVALWIYFQSRKPQVASKETQTEARKETGTQREYQLTSPESFSDEDKAVLVNFSQRAIPKFQGSTEKVKAEREREREQTEQQLTRKIPEKEEDCKTLQEWLDWKHPTKEEKKKVFS